MGNLIYPKMSAVMKDIGAIGKDQKNTAQNFKFRGIDQFVNALYPALVNHKVFIAPKVTSYQHEIREVTRRSGERGVDKHVAIMAEYTFWAEDGSNVVVGPIAAEGIDSGDKATNKALSAALKYALIQTFAIPTEDMTEGDSDSPDIPPNTENASKVSIPTGIPMDDAPPIGESFHPAKEEKRADSRWGDYIPTFGKYSKGYFDKKTNKTNTTGTKIGRIPDIEMDGYIEFWKKKAREEQKPLSKGTSELIDMVVAYRKERDSDDIRF